MPDITICKNPFRPQLDRVQVCARPGTRLDTVLRREGLISGRGRKLVRNHVFVVQVNGQWLLQDQWARRLGPDDVVLVALLPARGGGGSNPLQIVAMVALAAVTAGVGAWAAGAYAAAAGVSATSTAALMVGAGAAAAVAIGGGMLLSALFPPAKPPSTMAREQASPTYTIGAQGNMARLMESIPVQYGRFRVYPDFAAQPYTELDSNQTYLYQLFCLGQGEYDIEEIRIEDTPIGNFEEVEYEVVPPGGTVTLFPDNVVSSTAVQGIELKGPNEEGHATAGPFVANPAGTTTTQIAVDIAFPAGLFYANDSGGLDSRSASWTITAHPIDDDGNPSGSPFVLGNESYSNATNQPQMMTYRYDVPEGRYSISAVRTSDKDTSSRAGNTLQWAGLRAYLPSKRDYGNVTLVAMIIRATNNLNQSTARRINVIGTRKLRTWHPAAGWSTETVATRNPAWALADVCKNPDYGRNLPDSRVNLTALYRLAQIWEERGDTYDGVFDTATTLWDALTRIARVGRAMPMYYAGVIDFIRNEPKSVKTQMFTPLNIITNTFSADYVFPEHDSPDHVIVEFINEETWQPDEVTCALPGSPMLRPYRLQIPGITRRDQAWREGISLAAQHRDQRRFVSFQTELEGNIPRYGDLVGISHDVPKWGLSGFIESYDPETKTLVTSEPLEWWEGENHYIELRRRDGSPDGPYRVTKGAGDRDAVIADAIDGYSIYVSDGQGEEFTHYQFGPGERRGLLAQVVSATPDENGHVSLDFVNYAPSVHTAETGGVVPPPTPPSLLPMLPNAPIVDSVSVYASPTPGQQVISATPARGAERYEFRASSDMGASWIDLGTHLSSTITGNLKSGVWRVQARGIGTMHGPWATWNGVVSATMAPPPMLELLTATPQVMAIRLDWVLPGAPWIRSVEIWYSPTPDFVDATLLGEFRPSQRSHVLYGLGRGAQLWFWARIRDEGDQAGPWYPDATEPGIRGQSSTDSTEIQGYITQQIVTSALGAILMGDIESIPDIRETLIEHGIDISTIESNISTLEAQLADLAGAPDWDDQTAYSEGQIVKFGGALYRAIDDVPAGVPVSNTAYWEKIGDYASLGEAVSALLVRMINVEAGIDEVTGNVIAMSQEILQLQSDMTSLDGTVQGQAAAIEDLETKAELIDGKLQVQATDTSMLRAVLRDYDDENGLLADVLNEWDTRGWITETKKVIATEKKVQASVNAQLGAQIAGNSGLIDQLQNVVATEKLAQAQINQQLQSDLQSLDGKVEGQAQSIDDLETTVEEIDGRVESSAKRTSALVASWRDNDDENGALADVLNEWDTRSWIAQTQRVVATNQKSQAEFNLQLQSNLSALDGTVQGQAGALSQIRTNVEDLGNTVIAQAESINQVETSLNGVSSTVQDISNSVVDLQGKASATRTIKVGINNQGTHYMAGIGVGIDNDSGMVQSQVVVVADLFSVMHSINGTPKSVFAVHQGTTIIDTAMIDQLHGNKILANTLDANRITSSSFETKLLNTNTAYVKTANIEDLAVDAAKIRNLAVETIKIANDSVTIHGTAVRPRGSIPGSGASVSLNMSFSQTCTVTLVVLLENVRHYGTWAFPHITLEADGAEVAAIEVVAVLESESTQMLFFSPTGYTGNFSAGAHTFRVWFPANLGTYVAPRTTLIALARYK